MSSQLVKSAIKNHNATQLDYYAGKDKKTMLPVDSYYVRRHVMQFMDFAALNANEDILEVGCGMGKFTLPLLKKGLNLTGLDLSPLLLQKLLTYNDNTFPIELICSDILDVPAEYNEKFDLVIGFFTLHHFMNLEIYFQAMSRVLKKGGRMVFLEPHPANPLYFFQITFSPNMSWAGDKGVYMMRQENFRKAAEYAGCELTKIKKYGFFPPFVVNRKLGRRVELALEKLPLLDRVSAFQLIEITKEDS